MGKCFNVAAVCIPKLHYMVNLDGRLQEIKALIDDGKYFTINRARQYGKTTILMALEQYLKKDYYIVSMDFQMMGYADFKDEATFSIAFAKSFLRVLGRMKIEKTEEFNTEVSVLKKNVSEKVATFTLRELFENLSDLCAVLDKPMVLLIDEVDSASNNQVFLDFLAQLRAYYIRRMTLPIFRSVILAGVYDIKNLKRKLRPDEDHKVNSPWNIAADFEVDLSFSVKDITGMLEEYEGDHHTGMDIEKIAGLLYAYTSGYPFLVSRLCKLMDEELCRMDGFSAKEEVWTKKGFNEAVKIILLEKNTLFESLLGKLYEDSELSELLKRLLFTGRSISYNPDEASLDVAMMFGFIKNQYGMVAVANRIFETRLYNFYLSTAEMHEQEIYKASLLDKNQFVMDGHLNMRLILEKFVMHFHDLYGEGTESFVEEEGRKYFLLYLRPIINGIGNYYIESQTRELKRTDVIVDYRGEQFVIEMKIWHGNEYNSRGEKQLMDYLDAYHTKKGYMLSFNFNQKKQVGVKELVIEDKVLVEAVV